MWVRTLLLLLSASLLSACFPATELTENNAETVLTATNRIHQISNLTSEGFQDSTVSNISLKQVMAKTTTNLMGSCYDDQGSYLFSASELSQEFSMVFDRCAGHDAGELDGTLSGTFEQTENHYSTSMTGNLKASRGSESITFAPVSFDLTFSLNETNASLYVEHSGQFSFDTKTFKGTVSAQTLEPVGIDLSTLEITGHVTYQDSSGNQLDVEHDNNGVHLTFNGAFLKSFTHQQWASRYL